ncbi:DUF4097 domain-containing protein [Mycobacterium sp. Y57]|uniref:DUF4097 domain-containing protein n=1 Tax=Mycolicibacterium xanthum TaxID=2796469 RepID=UPI001C84945F|nr:DUF4097 domain-containing protein [Mycolicibacterium xanthum]MBX7433592.1 DUF4097 domain-containing protein [Mycolicibacterium xanthum]
MTTLTAPPSEPATPPPPLSPGGRTALRVVLIVVAAALVIGTVVALSTAAWGISRFRVLADSAALPSTLRSLALDTGSVPVVIRITSDRDVREPRVDMRTVTTAASDSRPLMVSDDGLTATVTIESDPTPVLHWGRAGEITVVLPPALAHGLTVTTRQQTGVVFAQADVDQLIAHTREGAVVLSGSARNVDITADHGDIRSREPISVSETFRAVTATGDISVDFAQPPATAEAEAGNGDVVLALPGPGPFFVTATTGQQHGSTVVAVPRTRDRDAAESVLTVRSDTGDVVVEELR